MIVSLRALALLPFLGLLAAGPALAGAAAPPVTSPAAATGAATVPGCNPATAAAANAAAAARLAERKARIDEAYDQKMSVQMLTCANQAAGASATAAGDMFSGNFMNEVQPIVGSALASHYGNFNNAIADLFRNRLGSEAGNAVGNALNNILGNSFGGGAATLQASYECDAMQKAWEAQQEKGITTTAKAPSVADLAKGKLPEGASEKYKKSWDASAKQGVFTNLKTAVDALPRAQVPAYGKVESYCDALIKSGVNARGCQ